MVRPPVAFEDDDVLSSSDLGEAEQDLGEDQGDDFDDSDDLMHQPETEHDEDASVSDEYEAMQQGGEHPVFSEPAAADEQAAQQLKPNATPDLLIMAQGTPDAGLMHVEVAALLRDARARLSPDQAAAMDQDLARLRKVLQAIAPCTVSGTEAAGFIRDLGLVPEDLHLPFQPPVVVAAVGAMPLDACMARGSVIGSADHQAILTLDVAVVMPASCFFRKAHLNYRYHARRALYLATLARHLSASPAFSKRSMQLDALQQDPTRPVLLLAGSVNSKRSSQGAGYQLRLIPCITPTTFPLPRLAPDRNGVRWVVKSTPAGTAQPTSLAASVPVAPAVSNGSVTANGHPPALPAAAPAPAPASTPTYNAGIVADMSMLAHAALLQKAAAALPSFSDALLLLKVWAHQQGLSVASSADGLDGHVLALLLAHLTEQGKLNLAMGALQAFRAALQALAGEGLQGLPKGITMSRITADALHAAAIQAAPRLWSPVLQSQAGQAPPVSDIPAGVLEAVALASVGASTPALTSTSNGIAPGSAVHLVPLPDLTAGAPPLQAWKRAIGGGAVLVDPLGWCNVAVGVGNAALAEVQASAKASLKALNMQGDPDAAFTSLFLTPSSLATQYDYLWAVQVPVDGLKPTSPIPTNKPSNDDLAGTTGTGLVRDVCVWREQEAAVEAIVQAALGGRARLARAVRRRLSGMHGQGQGLPVSSLMSGLPMVAGRGEVLVGARVDPTLALRLVDIGPAADSGRAATKFREFWGELSELRRFQDGKISEAVVWSAGPGARHCIPDQVVRYAVQRHRPGGSNGRVRTAAGVLDLVLRSEDESSDDAVLYTRLLDAATDKLSKQLRTLEGLALKVTGVQPLSSASRHTAAFPPVPHPLAGAPSAQAKGGLALSGPGLPRCMEPVDLLVQLENSGRWPAQPEPFIKMKAALGLQLAGAIESSLNLTTQASEGAVDVLADGFAFRLILYSGRDEDMLEEQTALQLQTQVPGPRGPWAPAKPVPVAVPVAAPSPETMPLLRSWHHGMITRVAGANPAYGPTCRLAKRWLACHLLSNHFAEEAVELMVAAVFTDAGSTEAPGSALTGFLRFLRLVAQHPWSARPLILDPHSNMAPDALRQVQRRFDGTRSGPHAMPALFLATSKDPCSAHWTREHPEPHALSRAVATAASCLAAASWLLNGRQEPTIPDTGTARDDTQDQAEQAAWEAAVVGALFSPSIGDLPVLVKVRREALPSAVRALPSSLTTPLVQRGQPDALSAVMSSRWPAPPKRARAFLDAFPSKAVEGRGPSALRAELLVGLEPLPLFVAQLGSQLLGAGTGEGQPARGGPGSAALPPPLGTLFMDGMGGQLLGLQWTAPAFLPAAPRPLNSHLMLPCNLASSGGVQQHKPGALMVVPDVARVLGELAELGEGVVEGVLMPKSCAKMQT